MDELHLATLSLLLFGLILDLRKDSFFEDFVKDKGDSFRLRFRKSLAEQSEDLDCGLDAALGLGLVQDEVFDDLHVIFVSKKVEVEDFLELLVDLNFALVGTALQLQEEFEFGNALLEVLFDFDSAVLVGREELLHDDLEEGILGGLGLGY